MRRCLELASLSIGSVSPNPMVGSVIVCDGMIIGEGYHEKYGGPHAEVHAINNVLDKHTNGHELLKRSTLYVNLEPCAHFGKTPPCSELIARMAIPNVVIGCRDPFEQVNGKGIEKLEIAGIKVTTGILEKDCQMLNRRFFTRVRKQRPYVILKWAQTEDGYFSPDDNTQRWITSDIAKQVVHKWRAEEDAVLVGKNTALVDNPRLNVREWQGRDPLRIVIDRRLELPQTLKLFDQKQRTIIFNEVKTETVDNVKFLQVEDFDHYLPQLMLYQLYLMDVQSLIVEGGRQTLDLFIKAGLWDEARIVTGNQSWGKGLKAPVISLNPTENIPLGEDQLQIIYNSS